jgi:hypothetical protein
MFETMPPSAEVWAPTEAVLAELRAFCVASIPQSYINEDNGAVNKSS